jgi:hypothetical protein
MQKISRHILTLYSFLLLLLPSLFSTAQGTSTDHSIISKIDSTRNKIKFIDNGFENASPFNWEIDSTGNIVISLVYDHERASLNRANQHWHFMLEGLPGSDFSLIIRNFDNLWNGQKAYPISDKTPCYVSLDGKKWDLINTELLNDNTLKFDVHLQQNKLFIASLPPYRISDLENFLSRIKANRSVEIKKIGNTSKGRPLEMVRIGNPNAPHNILLRARAHGFEVGGNWVVEGLVKSLLQKDAAPYLEKYCVYILPMANKDAVALGRTRFNAEGMDLNRNWDKPSNQELSPENYALETWIKNMIAKGKKPDLAIDLHNDRDGNLHFSHPGADNGAYLANTELFESLLYKYTWFTEGRKKEEFRNPGTLGEGLLERYGINAFIFELNFEWSAGLKKVPSAHDWELLGNQLRKVFMEYFNKK